MPHLVEAHPVEVAQRACGMVIPVTASRTPVLGCVWKRWNRKPRTPEARPGRCYLVPGPDRSRSSANRLPRFVYVLLAWTGRGRALAIASRRSGRPVQSAAIASAHSGPSFPAEEMVNAMANKGGQLSRSTLLTGSTRVPRALVSRCLVNRDDWKSAGASDRSGFSHFLRWLRLPPHPAS